MSGSPIGSPVPGDDEVDTTADPTDARDSGVILIFVLVAVILISMVSIPILSYVRTVFRAQEVQADRAQATELANGGVWVALSNEADLYDICPELDQTPAALGSSLGDVDVSCQLLDEYNLRPANEMPYDVAVIQADETLPAAIATADTYTNPSTSADPGAWLADRASIPTENTVWFPQLPVKVEASGDDRDSSMPPNTFDASFGSTCRVFFPGTFDEEIVIDEPAYFTSGVYYFTQPIVLRNGAHVVVGNGSEIGCTNDFESVALARSVPEPLNMSGLGGTLILGDEARITVDDAGGDDIFFAVNQRFVSNDETSVAASSDVAIIAVSGTHAPFLPNEALGMPLYLPQVIDVPASTVDTDGDPLATDSGYLPSTHTPAPSVPDAPVIMSVDDLRIGSEGRIAVTFSEPADGGAWIEYYEVTDSVTGQTCRTASPFIEGQQALPACHLTNIPDGTDAQVSVVAVNAVGPSASSATVAAPTVVLSGGGESPEMPDPTPAPTGASVTGTYADGVRVGWSAPAELATAPITYSIVRAQETTTGDVITCEAWWTETSCVLEVSDGLVDGGQYDITMESLVVDGDFDRTYSAQAPDVLVADDFDVTLGGGSAPSPSVPASTTRTRASNAILDFVTSTATRLDVIIDGYVAIPQGHAEIDAHAPGLVSVEFSGGMLAGAIDVGTEPGVFDIYFDNPVAQKRVRIVSDVVDSNIRADAVVQVNRSGSLAINSWVVGPSNNATTAAPGDAPPPPPGGDDDDPDDVYVDPYTGGGDPSVDYTANYVVTSPDPGSGDGLTPCADASQWAASYWDNNTFTGDPALQRCDTQIAFDWGSGNGPIDGQIDDFSARWVKTISIPSTADYDITIGGDDGYRLRIDGAIVPGLDDWNDGGYRTLTETVNLTAGDHVFEMEYYEVHSAARVSFDMETAAIGCGGSDPWSASYWNNNSWTGDPDVQRCESEINENWGSGNGPGGQADNFSGRWTRAFDVPTTADYSFTLDFDDGYWIYIDGVLQASESNAYTGVRTEVIELAAGTRQITVEMREGGGGARAIMDFAPVVAGHVCTDVSQWQASFWNNTDLSGAADLERCDSDIAYAWNGGPGETGQTENFSARWVKTVDVPSTDDYQFTVLHDDGMRISVDGVLVYDQWNTWLSAPAGFVTTLAAGQREIEVEYRQGNGGSAAQVDFERVALTCPSNQWLAEYYGSDDDAAFAGDPDVERCDSAIDFTWGSGGRPNRQRHRLPWALDPDGDGSGDRSVHGDARCQRRHPVRVDGVLLHDDWATARTTNRR